jgi:hypothetical protein
MKSSFVAWLLFVSGVCVGVVSSEFDLQRNCERYGVAKALFTSEIKCEALK